MNSQNALTKWALAQQNNWNGLKESDEAGEEILRGYNNRMGVKYNPTDAWSAITISNAVMTNMGAEDKNSARKLGFNPTKSHSGYVKDAFRTNANPEYRYNRYVAQKPGESNYSIGDILVKGRSDTKGWKYEDFAKAGSGYKSHGDIIVDKGEDADGQYVVLGGGNVSDTYKNEKVYLNKIDKKGYKVKLSDTQSGVQLPQEEEVVEEVVETIAPKITPNWWDYPEEEEVVAQQPIQQEVYSDELPYGVLSQLNAENQTALFGEQMFDEGGIVKPKGDPWEYKKDGDKYLTRKRGNKSWITTTGLPEESIKSMVFKEIPVSDRVKEATANYTREKKSQPKSEAPRKKEAWRYVEPSESNKSKKNPYVDYWEGNISKKEYEIQKDEPNGWLRKKFNIPEDYKSSDGFPKNAFEDDFDMDKFNRELKYERFKDFKNKGYSDVDIKIIMAQEESGEYVWNPDLETETGFGDYESQKMRDLKWKDSPDNFKNMYDCPPGQVYVNGKCTGQQSAGNSDSFFGAMPFFVGSVPALAGYTAFETMVTPYAHEYLSPVLDPVLGAAYDGAAAIYDGVAGAKKWVGDKTGWYKHGGPHDPPAGGIQGLRQFQETLKKPTTPVKKQSWFDNSQASKFAKNYNKDIKKVNQAHKVAGTKPLEITPEIAAKLQKKEFNNSGLGLAKKMFVDPAVRTGERIITNPIGFAKDVSTTAKDLWASPFTAGKELYDYTLGDGNFELNNVFDAEAAGTSLDLLGSLPVGNVISKGIRTGAKIGKSALKYGDDLVGASKHAGKFTLPKYKNTYRIEHGNYSKPSTQSDVTGKWFSDGAKPNESKFYLQNLKNESGQVIKTNNLLKGNDQPVRIMKNRVATHVDDGFGSKMPVDAKVMSQGKGNLTNSQFDEYLGQGASNRLKTNALTVGDHNALRTGPMFYNPSEGIVNANLVNKMRLGKNSILSSTKGTTFQNQSDAMKYLIKQDARNKTTGIKDYLPWVKKHGGPHDPPEVKQRKGSRKNYDNKEWTPSGLQFPTSVSSHLMKAEYVGDIDESTKKPVGWVGFPSLFQDSKPYANDQDNWVQTSEDNGWGPIYEEAKRRGEVYNFGEDKEAAIAFGEGSWKDQLLDEGVELTDKEVEEYRAGGYIVEEIE